MFDDHPENNNTPVPGNLPLGEPEDMFANTDSGVNPPQPETAPPVASGGMQQPSDIPPFEADPPEEPPSALEAGILKPKTPVASAPNPSAAQTPLPPIDAQPRPQNNMPPTMPPAPNAIKEPTLSRGIMVTIMSVVIVLVLLGSGWFAYSIFTGKEPASAPVAPVVEENFVPTQPEISEPVVSREDDSSQMEPVTSSLSEDIIEEEILVGESPDSDGDGIKDNREAQYGTEIDNWDTDGDGLSDGEEILIWHTDPTNPDTDGDSYLDAAEIKAGYNPAGPGRIGELNTSTSSSARPSAPSSSEDEPNTSVSSSASSDSAFEIEL